MGTVRFEDGPPFDLKPARVATASAVGATVLLTLPVYEPGPLRTVREIQVVMPRGHARQLARDLEKAWGLADQADRGVSR